MKKISKKTILLVLVAALCFSLIPASVMATGNVEASVVIDQAEEGQTDETTDGTREVPSEEDTNGEPTERIEEGKSPDAGTAESAGNEAPENTDDSVPQIVEDTDGIDSADDAVESMEEDTGLLTFGDVAIPAFAPFATAKSGTATQVVHTRSSDQIYYGYYTSYYTANGNTSFCLDPTVKGLPAGTYDVSGWLIRGQHDLLIKCAYYLYGGPGYDMVKYGLFENPDDLYAYALSHAAASYVYLNDPTAFQGLSSVVIDHLLRVIDSVSVQAMPPKGFEVFLYNVGNPHSQALMGWEYAPKGDLEIVKVSANSDMTKGNSCYSLKGAVFDVFNGNGDKVGSITTDADGKGKLEGLDVGNGYYLVEVKPPKGYAQNEELPELKFEIVSGETTVRKIEDVPQNDPIGVVLMKLDANTNWDTPQGNAFLSNAEFTVRYYAEYYNTDDDLNGVSPERTWIIKTNEKGTAYLTNQYLVSGDLFYYIDGNPNPVLPLGTVVIQETKAPKGYLLNSNLFIRQITSDGWGGSVFTYNAPEVPDEVIRGGVAVSKWDYELNRPAQPEGDATIAGAVFEVVNRSENSVVVDGTEFAPGEVVHTMTTGADGSASTANNLLPYGRFELREKTAPTGYLNTGVITRVFDITENGKIVDLKTNDGAIKNNVIRGSVKVFKNDKELGESHSQGSGTLAGATFEIVNQSAHLVLVDGVEYMPGEVVCTMVTEQTADGTYSASTPEYYLPYGSYLCREASPPEYGYLATGKLSEAFEIHAHGVLVELSGDRSIQNNPIRGDLKGVKASDGDLNRLANVPFRITSKTTGESHVLVTDRNGMFSTASDWNPHSQDTNRGETGRDGIWFGDIAALNDDVGALLFDDYIVEELECPANEGMERLSFEVSVYRHMTVIDLGTLTDDYIPVLEIGTTAMDRETTENHAYVSEFTTIVDTVYYSGLKPNETYTVKGVLMDPETGNPLLVGDREIHAEKTFKAPAAAGSVSMEFTFDSRALMGKAVVVFESLEYEGKEVAVHADIEDEGQTVAFKEPKIGTSASGENGEKDLPVTDEVTIVDVITYENLMPGKTYTLKGVLIDKETGKPLLIDNREVTAETTFTPESESGSVEVKFTFDSRALRGKTLVVFESLEYMGREIAVHADINDEGQTVTIKAPKIGTSASGENGEKEIPAAATVTVVDVVTHENLTPQKTYALKGVLMDQETGKPLLIDNREVTAETTFTPESESGSVEVKFTFDSRALQGKTLVVFESLEYEGKEIAVHADIEDQAQAVSVAPDVPVPAPFIKTGYGSMLWLVIAVAAGCAVGMAILIRRMKKKGLAPKK